MIATDAALHRSLEPMKPRAMQQLISPNVMKTYLGAWPFDPVADGRDLLQCQRQTQHFADRRHIVGGLGNVVRVTAAGVTVETICHWPDRVGARIDPLSAPPSIALDTPVQDRRKAIGDDYKAKGKRGGWAGLNGWSIGRLRKQHSRDDRA